MLGARTQAQSVTFRAHDTSTHIGYSLICRMNFSFVMEDWEGAGRGKVKSPLPACDHNKQFSNVIDGVNKRF